MRVRVRSICRSVGRQMNRRLGRAMRGDAGMSTAEYAVGTVAAVAFAAVLYRVVTSDPVMQALSKIIKSALSVDL